MGIGHINTDDVNLCINRIIIRRKRNAPVTKAFEILTEKYHDDNDKIENTDISVQHTTIQPEESVTIGNKSSLSFGS